MQGGINDETMQRGRRKTCRRDEEVSNGSGA
uniref:Uncharacterized protein n=1 Tax=Arundo donax TaxID=35708 RepID=A0A0A8YDC9_ARUDO